MPAKSSRPRQQFQACARCNKPFRVYPSEQGRARYCSRDCRYADRRPATLTCEQCGKAFTKNAAAAKQARTRFCSRRCVGLAGGVQQTAKAMVTRICPVCQSTYQTTQHHGGKLTCSKECAAEKRRRALASNAGAAASTSKLEDQVSRWLGARAISHTRQVRVSRFYVVDFQIGDLLIEVNGCYWHGCPEHFPQPTARQRARQARDRRLAGYCANRGIMLIVLWEHKLRLGDFSLLEAALRARAILS